MMRLFPSALVLAEKQADPDESDEVRSSETVERTLPIAADQHEDHNGQGTQHQFKGKVITLQRPEFRRPGLIGDFYFEFDDPC